MNTGEKQRFERLLKQQLEHVENSLDSVGQGFPPASDEPCDDVDLLNNHLITQIHVKLSDRLHRNHERIRQALRRIEAGTFGNCLLCHDEIEVARMNALPTTTLCVLCQDDHEAQKKNYFKEVG
jgi:DnaK suppressor protein